MNNFETLVTMTGEPAEILRFVQFVYGNNIPFPGESVLTGYGGFDQLNAAAEARCHVRLHRLLVWEPDLDRLVVSSGGGHIGRLILAASLKFRLTFALRCIDVDGHAEELAHAPETVVWDEYSISEGRCTSR